MTDAVSKESKSPMRSLKSAQPFGSELLGCLLACSLRAFQIVGLIRLAFPAQLLSTKVLSFNAKVEACAASVCARWPVGGGRRTVLQLFRTIGITVAATHEARHSDACLSQ